MQWSWNVPYAVFVVSAQSFLFMITEVDECNLGSHNCHSQGQCRNTAGNYTCNCNKGWSGNGVKCAGNIKMILNNLLPMPPKLAHISRARKQRYSLQILYANIISGENLTRRGCSRFRYYPLLILWCRPWPQNRLRFVLYQKCCQVRKLVWCVEFSAVKILCKSHFTALPELWSCALQTSHNFWWINWELQVIHSPSSDVLAVWQCAGKSFSTCHGGPSFYFDFWPCEAWFITLMPQCDWLLVDTDNGHFPISELENRFFCNSETNDSARKWTFVTTCLQPAQ